MRGCCFWKAVLRISRDLSFYIYGERKIYFRQAKFEVDLLDGKVSVLGCVYPDTKAAIATPNNIDVIANDELLTD